MLIKLFGDNRRDLLSVLLLLATRHDQFDIIQDILPKVNLGCILDPGQSTNTNANTSLKLTDNSLRHLYIISLGILIVRILIPIWPHN